MKVLILQSNSFIPSRNRVVERRTRVVVVVEGKGKERARLQIKQAVGVESQKQTSPRLIAAAFTREVKKSPLTHMKLSK